MGFTEESQGLC